MGRCLEIHEVAKVEIKFMNSDRSDTSTYERQCQRSAVKKNVTASTDNLTIFCGTAISISLVLAKITMGKEFFAFQSGREPAVSVDDGIR